MQKQLQQSRSSFKSKEKSFQTNIQATSFREMAARGEALDQSAVLSESVVSTSHQPTWLLRKCKAECDMPGSCIIMLAAHLLSRLLPVHSHVYIANTAVQTWLWSAQLRLLQLF